LNGPSCPNRRSPGGSSVSAVWRRSLGQSRRAGVDQGALRGWRSSPARGGPRKDEDEVEVDRCGDVRIIGGRLHGCPTGPAVSLSLGCGHAEHRIPFGREHIHESRQCCSFVRYLLVEACREPCRAGPAAKVSLARQPWQVAEEHLGRAARRAGLGRSGLASGPGWLSSRP